MGKAHHILVTHTCTFDSVGMCLMCTLEAEECGQTRHYPCVISGRRWHPLRYGSPCPFCTLVHPSLLLASLHTAAALIPHARFGKSTQSPHSYCYVSSVPAFGVQPNKLKNPLCKHSSALLMDAGFTLISAWIVMVEFVQNLSQKPTAKQLHYAPF